MKMTGGTWNGIAAYGATGRSRIRDYHVVVIPLESSPAKGARCCSALPEYSFSFERSCRRRPV